MTHQALETIKEQKRSLMNNFDSCVGVIPMTNENTGETQYFIQFFVEQDATDAYQMLLLMKNKVRLTTFEEFPTVILTK